ncbi:glycosyltransferase family 2 protein [Paenibacillus sp. ACRRX]|uniref:glycosyltransferase family 2 protein n=1 Tax=Paenibacillus sp. ACRRX TaxID=2918206 RepID=UPI001EF729EE|nr:glycosyltransferase family 2 protein [Paenibacillus sp. ACRRX]MCG7408652.1 glycosyltransferase family 2 protein [Paenibacillus sp. ACRRX]
MSPRPLLSVCMIVKNEERLLPDCLLSIADVADEVIIIDTGSTDGTISIAEQYHAKVALHPWSNHFADARNAALQQATGEWILSLDADERLVPEDQFAFKELLQKANCTSEGWFLQVEHTLSEDPQATPASVNPLLRVFRNRPEYRFEGAIHEQIAPVILRERPQAELGFSTIRLRHIGYQPDIVRDKRKIERNAELLELTLAREGREPFHLFNLAVERIRQGKMDQALILLREARATTPISATFAHLMVKYEALTCAALGRYEEAVQLCAAGISHYPDYTDLHFAKAIYHDAAGDRGAALRAMREAARLGVPPSHYHTEGGVGTYRAYAQLAAWALESRAWHDADAAYRASLDDARCPASVWLAWQRMRVISGIAPAVDTSSVAWLTTQTEARQLTLQKAHMRTLACNEQIDAAKHPMPSEPAASHTTMPLGGQQDTPLTPPLTDHSALTNAEGALRLMHQADIALARIQQQPCGSAAAKLNRLVIPIGTLALTIAEQEARPHE